MSGRVLFVAYNFPPVGGAGVQRTTKFVKYLPEHGWCASVLTVANPSVPVFDESLFRDVPQNTTVCRAKTFEPDYRLKTSTLGASGEKGRRARLSLPGLAKDAARRMAKMALQPDAQLLWLPDAIRKGEQLLRQVPHDVILVTAPPFSSFFVGAALSRIAGLPLVLDYRDEWMISNAYWENKRLGPASRRFQEWMQLHLMRTAKAIVATTRSSAAALDAIRIRAGSAAKVTWIYNGFDRDDFPRKAPAPPVCRDSYRLAYVGTLWALTDVAPLVGAVRQLASRHPKLASHLELIFAGRRTREQQRCLEGLKELPCRVTENAYLDHSAALDLLRSADGVCLLLSDVPHADRVVPGKLFESLAAEKPILAITPRGELWDLLANHPDACLAEPLCVPQITEWLAERIRRHLTGSDVPSVSTYRFAQFERRNQAGELAQLLESVNSYRRCGRGSSGMAELLLCRSRSCTTTC